MSAARSYRLAEMKASRELGKRCRGRNNGTCAAEINSKDVAAGGECSDSGVTPVQHKLIAKQGCCMHVSVPLHLPPLPCQAPVA